jgi:hypothetical protein
MHLAIAAAAPPEFFFEVVALLVTTALVAYFCHRIGIMPIVAFLVTGALIGPHALGFVRDEALIEATAEVGVILLLFTIGIEFSLEKLSRAGCKSVWSSPWWRGCWRLLAWIGGWACSRGAWSRFHRRPS